MLIKIIITFSVRILGALLAFIISFLIAQKLSLDEAGYFFLAIALLGLLNLFGLCGLHVSTLRFMSIAHGQGKQNEVNTIAVFSFLIVLLMGVFKLALFYKFDKMVAQYLWGDPELSFIFFYTALISVPMSLNMLIAHWLQAMSKAVLTVFFLSVNIPFLVSLALVLFSLDHAGHVLQWYLVAAFASMFACLFVFLFFCKGFKFAKIEYRKLVKASLPTWGTSLIYVLINWSGHFIASIWVDAGQIALLAIANRSALLVSLVLVAVNMVVAPKYALLYSEGRVAEMSALAKKITKTLSAIVIPFVIVLAFCAEFILAFFGSEYVAASTLLIILLIGQLVVVLSGAVGPLLNMSGNEKYLNIAAVTAAVLVTALNLTLIPFIGVVGAAIATALAVISQNFVAAWYVKKRLGFNVYAFIGK